MKSLEIMARRIRNSRLAGTALEAPDEVVSWHGAMQAQDYGPAKWSIGQRAVQLVDEDVDRALAAGAIVRTHALRPTWHFIARDDVRWLLALSGPRVEQHNRGRYRDLGLDERTLARCEAVIVSTLEGASHLTRNAIAAILEDHGIGTSGQRLAYILMHCELVAAICSGEPAGKQQTYALVDERIPKGDQLDHDEALVELTRRYLRSHGPATVQDLRWWSSLTVADIKNALSILGSEVQSEAVDDMTFWSMASDTSREPAGASVHLLQAYDELLVGYTASRYFGDPRAAAARAASNDRSLPNGVVLVNGRVFGHWGRTTDKDSIRIELLAYEDVKSPDAARLKAAVDDLGRFLGRHAVFDVTRI